MTEENIQAHLNDCSQHSSKFNCHEFGMVSENFLVAHALLFIFNSKFTIFKKKLFALFLQIHDHLTRASHPYLQRETTKKWSKKMMK